MTVLRAGAAALVVFAVSVVLVPPPARAAAPEKSAWWYRPKTTTPTAESPQGLPTGNPVVPALPAGPPTVSGDQLHVEGTPAGAVAVAALTFRLAEGETSPVLTVTPASGSVVPPEAVVLACRAAIEWAAPEASPGAWGDRPLADCTTSVRAQVLEGGVLVFALQPLMSGTHLDVVIGPGAVASSPAGGGVGSAFALTFNRPGPDALATAGGGSPASSSDFELRAPFEEDFDLEPEMTTGESFTPADGSAMDWVAPMGVTGSFGPSVDPDVRTPLPRPAAPVLAAAREVGAAAQKLALALLLLGAVAAYTTSADQPSDVIGLGRFRRQRRSPTAGSDARGGEGGLGRLRRPRTGRPPAL